MLPAHDAAPRKEIARTDARARQYRALTQRLRASDRAIARATRRAATASRMAGRAAFASIDPLARRGDHGVGRTRLDIRLVDLALELARGRSVGDHLLPKLHDLHRLT